MTPSYAKYCLLCGTANTVTASFCEQCDADLMNAPVEALRREGSSQPTDAVAVAASSAVDADAQENPSQAVECFAEQQPALELELVANPTLRFLIQPGQSVGRSDRADIVLNGVPDLEYISRAHARFIQRRDQWYVQYIAEGNSITVDGVVSNDDAEIALYDQSVLVLSFTPFRVKLVS